MATCCDSSVRQDTTVRRELLSVNVMRCRRHETNSILLCCLLGACTSTGQRPGLDGNPSVDTAGPADVVRSDAMRADPPKVRAGGDRDAPNPSPPPGTPAGLPEGRYYDIVYVRAPRYGDETQTKMPEVKDPINVEPGTDLMLMHPDGREEVLVAGGDGAIWDPHVSFDAKWVYFAKFHDAKQVNARRNDAPTAGADIYKINLSTRQVVRLTFQEWTPNRAAGDWAEDHLSSDSDKNSLRYGIFNLGPCPLPGGKLMFSSSRNGYLPNKSFTFPNLQLFVMDTDGSNVELVGHLNLGSALHPTILADGRVMFSSYEAQGLRDRRVWGLWAIWPDGRGWEPLMSAFAHARAFHFQAQLSNGMIVVEEYYNQNNNGFGTFIQFPAQRPLAAPPFGSPSSDDLSNPAIQQGWWPDGRPRLKNYSFSPAGLQTLTAFAHGSDNASHPTPDDGDWSGKVAHPSSAPHNELLLSWSSGPSNNQKRPTPLPRYDAGVYLAQAATPIGHPDELVKVRDLSTYNEMMPRAVVPYGDIYGIAEPWQIPWLPNDGTQDARLPAGTPFGLVGTSSFYKRDTAPGSGSAAFDGLDPFNTSQNGASSNWSDQGADAGRYSDKDIFAVRVLSMEPTSHRSYGPAANHSARGFYNHANERLRILGEIPLRKRDASGRTVVDVDGNPDTSFMALIPADVPFTFQTIDQNGMVLNMSQTWHQVRPGEVRVDCGGCHAHSQIGTRFEDTHAATGAYRVPDLAHATPLLTKDQDGRPTTRSVATGAVDVEYYRDIKPLLERSCVSCHSQNGRAEAGLVLDDTRIVDGFENTYNRLARDGEAQYGIPPVIKNGTWRQSNASRYIRKFQSRRSLLIWKIFGRRLDGWHNDDHPTERVPGDRSTLPNGADPNVADLDYTGQPMPPPGAGVPPLSEDEKLRFVRWIDLGCPISRQDDEFAKYGWFLDELRPTLTVSVPRAGQLSEPPSEIKIGAFDYYSGLNARSLSVVASFTVNGQPPGSELAPLLQQSVDGIWRIALSQPLSGLSRATLTVRARDRAGNVSEIVRTFSTP